MAEATGSERRPHLAEHRRAKRRLFSKAGLGPRNPGERPTNKKGSFKLHQRIMELFEVGDFESVLLYPKDPEWENCTSSGTGEEEAP